MEIRLLNISWGVLMILTITSALFAETATPSVGIMALICVTILIKGRVIIDYLIGLRGASPTLRKLMLSYFYILPVLISLAFLFPNVLEKLTTL